MTVKLNLTRLEALLQRAEDQHLTGQVVLHFHEGVFKRWEETRSGAPKDLPLPTLIEPEPGP